ncbi:MAG: choice-of-anchor A family protein, partial [Melioribacteraceae bacterium]|nr:choice-of-anchor A family protein [Melioribacteraceae bacterium]
MNKQPKLILRVLALTMALMLGFSSFNLAQLKNVNKITDYTSIAKVSGTDKVTSVKFDNPLNPGTVQNVNAGTFKGTLNGNDEKFFCIDIGNPLATNEDYWDEGSTPSQITYILNNYYPHVALPYTDALSTEAKEAAAVQVSIWHYSDGLDISTVQDATIKARALQIVADVEANHTNNATPIQTLVLMPSPISLPQGVNATFYAYALDLLGNYLTGVEITLTTNLGSLNHATVLSNVPGSSQLITLSYNGIGNAEVTATAEVQIPQGTRYVHKASPNSKQKLVLATPTTDTKSIKLNVKWYEIPSCDLNGYKTFTIGGWGSPSNSQPGQIRDQYFAQVFPNGLTVGNSGVGNGYTLKLTSASAVKTFLPNTGTSDALTQNWVNPGSNTVKNTMVSQVVAVTLAVNYSAAGVLGNNTTPIGDLYIASGAFAGKTVNEFLVIANKAISGVNTGYTFSQINDAATNFNENFDNGTVDHGFLECGQNFQKASLGDYVWIDTDNDGIQDNNESGIQGVTVKLYDCSTNSVVATTTTDINGKYLFSNLLPGSYKVEFIAPNGYEFTLLNAGSDDEKDSDANVTTGMTDCYTINWNDNIRTVDAGLFLTPVVIDADLEVSKTASKTSLNDGDIFTYTVKVKNNGPASATGVAVTDIIPGGLEFLSYTATQGTYDYSTGLWTVGILSNGGTAELTISVKVDVDVVNTTYFDLGLAKDYNLFVIEDASQPSSDTQGKVAVGRNATFGSYSVGDQLPANSGDVLVVGNNLTYTSGAVYNGNVVYGNSTNMSAPNFFSVSISGGTLRQDNPIDFAAAKSYLENLSSTLAAYPVNGTKTFEWGGLKLVGNDPFLNVFSVLGSELSTANNFEVNAPNGSVVLINIDGTNVTWTGGLTVTGTSSNNVLFNFPNATTLKIQGIDVRGSILAPFAAVDFVSGVQNGQMVCKSLTGIGQFNLSSFIGSIPQATDIVNVAFISATLNPDPVSTNNSSSVTVVVGAVSGGTNNGGNTGNNNGGTNNGGTNNGGSWEQVGTFANEIIYAMAYDGNTMYAGTFGGKIYKSSDNGVTWTRINSDMTVAIVWALKVNNGSLFAATEQGVFKFNGTTWVLSGLAGIDVHSLTVSGNGTIYAGTWGSGVYISSDNGTTWMQLNEGFGYFNVIQSLVATTQHVYAATFGGGVFRLDASTNTWVKLSLCYQFAWSLASTSSDVLFAGTYGNGLYSSHDGGMTWNSVTGLNVKFVYSVSVGTGDVLYASSLTNGVFVSNDLGATWTSLGMGGQNVSSVTTNNGDLFAGTKDGLVFKMSNGTTDAEEVEELPTTFSLDQNYPNPFNPTTTIQFAIPASGKYSLRIYNILGQEVTTLLNGELTPGVHKFNFDARSLASGI